MRIEQMRLGWGSMLGAASLAMALASVVWKIDGAQTYRDFVVGHIAWGASSKTIDYWGLAVFLGLFALFVFGACKLFTLLNERGDNSLVDALDRLFLIAVVPAGWWVASSLIPGAFSNDYMVVSAIAVIVVAATAFLLTRLTGSINNDDVYDLGGGALYSIFFAIASALAIALVLARGVDVPHEWRGNFGRYLTVTSVLATAAYLVLIGLLERDKDRLKRKLFSGIVWLQLPLPFLFLALMPPLWRIDGQLSRGYEATLLFWMLLLILVGIGFFAWYRNYRRWRTAAASGAVYRLEATIAPLGLLAFLLLLHVESFGPFQVSGDDYHWGERLVPWQQLWDFGKIPFVDLTPVHGFIHIIRGALGQLFFDGQIASLLPANSMLVAVAVAATFFSIRMVVGTPAAFLLTYTFVPALMMDRFWLVVPGLLFLVTLAQKHSPLRWLLAWGLCSIVLLTYVLSTGSAFVLATIPAALWMSYRAWVENRKELRRVLLIALAVAIALVVFTPVGQIVLGMLKYLLGNSSANTTAYGIPWDVTRGVTSVNGSIYSSPFVFELIRLAWIPAVLMSGVILFRIAGDKRKHLSAFFFGVGGILFLLALSAYSLGRIDGAWSRTGMTSIWAIGLFLPVLALLADREKYLARILLLTPIAGAIYFGIFSGPLPDVRALLARTSLVVDVNAAVVTQAVSTHGIQNIGAAIFEPAHLKLITNLREELSRLLRPGETFLDLSNRPAEYYYLGLPIPIFEMAVYNAPTTKMQQRLVADIDKNLPPVVLADGESFQHDGGSAALRAYLVYRKVVQEYVPIKRGPFIFLVEPTRAAEMPVAELNDALASANHTDANWTKGISNDPARKGFFVEDKTDLFGLNIGDSVHFQKSGDRKVVEVKGDQVWVEGNTLDPSSDGFPNVINLQRKHGTDVTNTTSVKNFRLTLLDKAFRVSDLRKIPVAWGRAFDDLHASLNEVKDFSGTPPSAFHNMGVDGPGRYLVQGDDPYVSFDLSESNLRGAEAGMLYMEFHCKDRKGESSIEIYWSDASMAAPTEDTVTRLVADDGKLLVPLDASPRWLLSDRLATLRLDLADPNACSAVEFKNLKLYQRKAVEKIQ